MHFKLTVLKSFCKLNFTLLRVSQVSLQICFLKQNSEIKILLLVCDNTCDKNDSDKIDIKYLRTQMSSFL